MKPPIRPFTKGDVVVYRKAGLYRLTAVNAAASVAPAKALSTGEPAFVFLEACEHACGGLRVVSHLSHSHYRITDKVASSLAKAVRRPLPAWGRELRVEMPDGALRWLRREVYPLRLHKDAPKRGWVWIVW